MKCCCRWGAALPKSGEWPEFDCGLCPQHGYGALGDGDLQLNDDLCKHHTKFVSGKFFPEDMGGNCSGCGNFYDRLYTRSRSYAGRQGARVCVHCIDLQIRSGGRGGGRGGQDVERPRNQPTPTTMHGVPGPCVYCGNHDARPKYTFQNQIFSACGWGHAGLFMDAVMDLIVGPEGSEQERRELIEGEEYVRKSLGFE